MTDIAGSKNLCVPVGVLADLLVCDRGAWHLNVVFFYCISHYLCSSNEGDLVNSTIAEGFLLVGMGQLVC